MSVSADAIQVLGYRPFDPLISKRFRKLCGHKGVVPASYIIPKERISIVGEHAVAYGGFGDVWRGTYSGRDVAIKALRVYKNDDVYKVKRVALSVAITRELFIDAFRIL